jgi:hypothetical protein
MENKTNEYNAIELDNIVNEISLLSVSAIDKIKKNKDKQDTNPFFEAMVKPLQELLDDKKNEYDLSNIEDAKKYRDNLQKNINLIFPEDLTKKEEVSLERSAEKEKVDELADSTTLKIKENTNNIIQNVEKQATELGVNNPSALSEINNKTGIFLDKVAIKSEDSQEEIKRIKDRKNKINDRGVSDIPAHINEKKQLINNLILKIEKQSNIVNEKQKKFIEQELLKVKINPDFLKDSNFTHSDVDKINKIHIKLSRINNEIKSNNNRKKTKELSSFDISSDSTKEDEKDVVLNSNSEPIETSTDIAKEENKKMSDEEIYQQESIVQKTKINELISELEHLSKNSDQATADKINSKIEITRKNSILNKKEFKKYQETGELVELRKNLEEFRNSLNKKEIDTKGNKKIKELNKEQVKEPKEKHEKISLEDSVKRRKSAIDNWIKKIESLLEKATETDKGKIIEEINKIKNNESFSKKDNFVDADAETLAGLLGSLPAKYSELSREANKRVDEINASPAVVEKVAGVDVSFDKKIESINNFDELLGYLETLEFVKKDNGEQVASSEVVAIIKENRKNKSRGYNEKINRELGKKIAELLENDSLVEKNELSEDKKIEVLVAGANSLDDLIETAKLINITDSFTQNEKNDLIKNLNNLKQDILNPNNIIYKNDTLDIENDAPLPDMDQITGKYGFAMKMHELMLPVLKDIDKKFKKGSQKKIEQAKDVNSTLVEKNELSEDDKKVLEKAREVAININSENNLNVLKNNTRLDELYIENNSLLGNLNEDIGIIVEKRKESIAIAKRILELAPILSKENDGNVANISLDDCREFLKINDQYVQLIDFFNQKNEEENKADEVIDDKKIDIKTEEQEKINEKLTRFGLTPEDLEKVEGFEQLSFGQRLLALENLAQWLLDTTRTQASKEFEDKKKADLDKTIMSGDGKISKAVNWTGSLFKNIKHGLFKEYKLVNLEKSTLNNIKSGEQKDEVMGALKVVVDGTKKGPEVEVGENGDLEIQYFSKKDFDETNLTEAEKKIVDECNQAATEFSKIPVSWSYELTNTDNNKKYKKAKDDYEQKRSEVAELIKNKEMASGSPEQEAMGMAMSVANGKDAKLYADQFLKSNPDVESALLNIEGNNIKNHYIVNSVKGFLKSEKSLAFASGFMIRAVTAHILGAIALPAIALGYGAWRGKIKGKEELDKKDALSSHKSIAEKQSKTEERFVLLKELESLQKTKESNEKLGMFTPNEDLSEEIENIEERIESSRKSDGSEKNFVDGSALDDKLKHLMARISEKRSLGSFDTEERSAMFNSLKARIDYTKRKLEEGLINFGDSNERLANNYKLINTLSEACNILGSSFEKKDDIDSVHTRIDNILETRKSEISVEQKRFLQEKLLEGALIGATFATAGYIIRDLYHLYQGDESVVKSTVRSVLGKKDEIASPVEGGSEKMLTGKKISEIEEDIKKTVPTSQAENLKTNPEVESVGNNGSEMTDSDTNNKEVPSEKNDMSPKSDAEVLGESGSTVKTDSSINNEGVDTNVEAGVPKEVSEAPIESKTVAGAGVDTEKLATEAPDSKSVTPTESTTPKVDDGKIVESATTPIEAVKTPVEVAGAQADISKGVETAEVEARGLDREFKIKLGEGGVPKQLERVFQMIAVDNMDIPKGVDFGAEQGARSLNIAQNLIKLAEGHGVAGVDKQEFLDSVAYNPKTGELNILNHTKFNEIVDKLDKHSIELWENHTLKTGAAAYLDEIKPGTWSDIVHAEGMQQGVGVDGGEVNTGIHGHNEISDQPDLDNDVNTQNIVDFEKDDIVQNANRIQEAQHKIDNLLRGGGTHKIEFDPKTAAYDNEPSEDWKVEHNKAPLTEQQKAYVDAQNKEFIKEATERAAIKIATAKNIENIGILPEDLSNHNLLVEKGGLTDERYEQVTKFADEHHNDVVQKIFNPDSTSLTLSSGDKDEYEKISKLSANKILAEGGKDFGDKKIWGERSGLILEPSEKLHRQNMYKALKELNSSIGPFEDDKTIKEVVDKGFKIKIINSNTALWEKAEIDSKNMAVRETMLNGTYVDEE